MAAPRNSGTLRNFSGTITSGGSAQTVVEANPDRDYILIVNISNTQLWIDFGENAVADEPSIPLAAAAADGTPGGSFESSANFVPTGRLSIIGATTGKKFICREG